MSVPSDAIHEIVAEIWESMLGMSIDPAPVDHRVPSGREVCAAVQITGAWEGAVVMACSESAASGFTAAMLGLDDEVPSEGDVQDVMGELANMVGGNVKAALGVEANLSLPTVAVGMDLEVRVPGAAESARATYVAGGLEFTVLILAKTPPAIAAVG